MTEHIYRGRTIEVRPLENQPYHRRYVWSVDGTGLQGHGPTEHFCIGVAERAIDNSKHKTP